MSNLLVITDVARLRKIFSRLTDDKNIRLRIVNNLEKGGEEIAIEKPDVVFVQTHLSGLSADILLMHLKKQLGRKRSRFVLLAANGQTAEAALKQYQGWLDTTSDDTVMFGQLQSLLAGLLQKNKKSPAEPAQAAAPENVAKTEAVSGAESTALLGSTTPSEPPPVETNINSLLPTVTEKDADRSLEDQGITYAPKQRLKVYSEFNSSFDNAVNNTATPEPVDETSAAGQFEWDDRIETAEVKPVRSKRGTFLLWLIPVVITVVIVTYMQQRKPEPTSDIKKEKVPQTAAATPQQPAVAAPAAQPTAIQPATAPTPTPTVTPTVTPAAAPAAAQAQKAVTPAPEVDKLSDKLMLKTIAENRTPKKSETAVTASLGKLSELPGFIPKSGYDKNYSAENPGWERYKSTLKEFKVLREAKQQIKAIQIIDRGGNGLPESYMNAVLRQVSKKPVTVIDTSEKKEGYEIQRGKITDNIKAVFYRDENGGRLRAFVLTWQ